MKKPDPLRHLSRRRRDMARRLLNSLHRACAMGAEIGNVPPDRFVRRAANDLIAARLVGAIQSPDGAELIIFPR
ncbi:MAG TPA: hypothetical protein VLM89_11895 [Phycisphaerae bacterium]|nr:hypothetical protein [Phycisphaerae bacterium]